MKPYKLSFLFLFLWKVGNSFLSQAIAQDTNLILINQAYLTIIQEKAKLLDSITIYDKSLPPSPSDTVITNIPSLKPIVIHRVYRTFQKICPECTNICISTNLILNGGSNVEKWSRVQFICTNTECNNIFQEELKEPIKKSPPMVEIK